MATPTVVTGGTQTAAAINGTNGTLTWPTLSQNDITFVCAGRLIKGAETDITMSTSGYTKIGSALNSTGHYMALFRKVQGSSPDTTAVVFGSDNGTPNSTDGMAVVGLIIRGGDTTNIYGALNTATGSSTNPNPPSIVTTKNNSLVAAFATSRVYDVTGVTQPTGYGNLLGTGATETNPSSTYRATKSVATSGTTEDPGTFGSWDTGTWCAITIEIIEPSITGSMAVTEGADTASFAGDVIVQGSLSATEGADTFAGTGDVIVQGILSVTEGGTDTFAGAGTVADGPIVGSMAATEGADTFAGTGTILIRGSMAATEGSDTFSGTGKVLIQGALGASESGSDTFSASGDVLIQGILGATEGSDTFAGAGDVLVQGTLTVTEGADTFAGVGDVIVQGILSVSETGDDTFAASGTVGLAARTGTMAAVEGADTFSASGNLGPVSITLYVWRRIS